MRQLSAATAAVSAVGVAAAVNKKKCYDNEPDPLVLKQIAKTVHNVSSVKFHLEPSLYVIILWGSMEIRDRKKSINF